MDLNATQAAIRAGYHPKMAAKLVAKGSIAAEIARRKGQQLDSVSLTAVRVLEEMRRVALSNVQDLFDEQGNLRPIHTLTRDQAASIAGLEVVKRNLTAGDGQTDTVYKLKAWDKPRTLEMLAKHFGLLTERIEHSGDLRIIHELPE